MHVLYYTSRLGPNTRKWLHPYRKARSLAGMNAYPSQRWTESYSEGDPYRSEPVISGRGGRGRPFYRQGQTSRNERWNVALGGHADGGSGVAPYGNRCGVSAWGDRLAGGHYRN